MAGTKLTPEKITSPFQLMAAWFSMLVLISSVLLTAAAKISEPDWAAGYLVIFTSVVVIVVLACVTLMLTIFRPHLQDGKEYASWLKDKNTYSAGFLIREQLAPSPRRNKISRSPDATEKQQSRSGFLISVTNAPTSQMVVKALNTKGFTAEIYKESNESNALDEHEAIWVGHRVPFKDAIDAIAISVALWPHLKYLELSNDGRAPPDEIHDQMYIGGSTSTAKESGLRAWNADDLASLSNASSLSEFHAAIRRKYS